MGTKNYMACGKNGSYIMSMICTEGKMCIGPSNSDEAILRHKATAIHRKDALCRKGRIKDK